MKNTLGLLTILLVCAGCVDIQKLTDSKTQPKATEAESYSLDTNRFYGLTLGESNIDQIISASKITEKLELENIEITMTDNKKINTLKYKAALYDSRNWYLPTNSLSGPSNEDLVTKKSYLLFKNEKFVGIYIHTVYPSGRNSQTEFIYKIIEQYKKFIITPKDDYYKFTAKGKGKTLTGELRNGEIQLLFSANK